MDKSELANAHARWNAALEHLGVLLEQRCADPRPTPPHLKAELRRRLVSLQLASASCIQEQEQGFVPRSQNPYRNTVQGL